MFQLYNCDVIFLLRPKPNGNIDTHFLYEEVSQLGTMNNDQPSDDNNDGNDSDNNRVLLDDLLSTMTKNLKSPQRLGSDHSQNE